VRRLLGEGLFIVIGVLAAFALDSWWDSKKSRREELSRLREMRLEFAVSKAALDTLALHHHDRVKRIERLETLLVSADANSPRDSVLVLGQALWTFENYMPTMPAYEELLATTGLRAVRSDKLRRALVEYESVLKRNTDWDEYVRSSSIASWESLLGKHMPYLADGKLTDRLRRLLPDVSRIAADLEFRNLIGLRMQTERDLADHRAALASVVAQVIKLIDAELKS
jgi:hypothetical protein